MKLSVKLLLAIVFGLVILLQTVPKASAVVECPWAWQPASSVGTALQGVSYSYTLYNTSQFVYVGDNPNIPDVPQEDCIDNSSRPRIMDWELPYFNNTINLASITSPTGWNYAIETIGTPNGDTRWNGAATWQDPSDPMYQGQTSPFTTVTQVLHWYNVDWANGENPDDIQDAILPGGSLSGFGFIGGPTSIAAPYQSSWEDDSVISGDPGFPVGGIPFDSPNTPPNPVPEPATVLLLGSGLAGLAFYRRKRK